MPIHGLTEALARRLQDMERDGRLKGPESVVAGFVPPKDGRGPRFLIEGEGNKPFLRMNSNSYLGMALRSEIADAEDKAVDNYGTGPGASVLSAGPGRRTSRWSVGLPTSITAPPRCCSRLPMPPSWGAFRRS